MVYWLMANPNAGEKDNRGAEFWRNYLESAGIVDIRDCSLDDKNWTEEVGPRDFILAAGGDGWRPVVMGLSSDRLGVQRERPPIRELLVESLGLPGAAVAAPSDWLRVRARGVPGRCPE